MAYNEKATPSHHRSAVPGNGDGARRNQRMGFSSLSYKAGVVLGEFYGADSEIQCFTARNATERALETAYATWRPPYTVTLITPTTVQCKPKS